MVRKNIFYKGLKIVYMLTSCTVLMGLFSCELNINIRTVWHPLTHTNIQHHLFCALSL